MISALFTHLLEHKQINKDLPEPPLEDYDLIPSEQLPTTGSYTQDKMINKLIRKNFGQIPQVQKKGGLNKKRYEDVIKVPFVVPSKNIIKFSNRKKY